MKPPAQPPAIRVKSQWFKAGGQTPEQQGGAVAFIAWRVAQQMIKRMRAAGFDIDPGAPYFGFMREVLVFLLAVADRLAYERLAPDERARFLGALVHHVADHLEDNEGDLLGRPEGPTWAQRFVAQFESLQGHYAEFDGEPGRPPEAGFRPGFAFYRYLGHRLEPGLPEKDRRWVLDQVMAIEAPEAVDLIAGAMNNLHDPEPRTRRRSTLSGE